MGAVVALLAVVVALLAFLVVGLLRSHAEILRRLADLGAGVEDPAGDRAPRVQPGVISPPDLPPGRPAHDVAGATLDGGAQVVRTTGVDHDTLLLFLSSGCLTCRDFWEALRRPGGLEVPEGTRGVAVVHDADAEIPAALSDLAGPGTPLLLSSSAWADFEVPGSPYAIYVDGPSGTVVGEGTGGSWEQVAAMLAQATGDLAFVGERTPRARKARRDARFERDTDAELLAAGIRPGDPSLYPQPGTGPGPGEPPAEPTDGGAADRRGR